MTSATRAIASASLGQGRRHGLTIAAGIFCGSMTWAVAASLGLAAILSQYTQALILMRILGGLYLLAARLGARVDVGRLSEPWLG